MGIINILAYAIIILFAIFGFKSGFLHGITKLLGWVIALILAIKIGPAVANFLKNSLSISDKIAHILGGVIVFILIIIVITIIVSILKKFIKVLHLSFFDRILGLVLGGIQSMIVIFLISFAVQWLPISENNKKSITEAKVVNWNNKTVAEILSATKLDKKIQSNKYYKELLNQIKKIKKKTSNNK
ncbi:MAG: CvpA family protein [Candidatus Cloacimonetes bacterium]|nr:CvpA family protein [Candidatus Cloacimonadota bacterium]MBL7086236.1 CvpA family protein [Candidatus Cloacimonadota bacterium]